MSTERIKFLLKKILMKHEVPSELHERIMEEISKEFDKMAILIWDDEDVVEEAKQQPIKPIEPHQVKDILKRLEDDHKNGVSWQTVRDAIDDYFTWG